MLNHPTFQSLKAMQLEGMAQAFQEQLELGYSSQLSFEERLSPLVDREVTYRDSKGFSRRLQKAKLKQNAALVRALASCEWVRERHNVIITGPTGVGKTYIACALAHQACQVGFGVLYA